MWGLYGVSGCMVEIYGEGDWRVLEGEGLAGVRGCGVIWGLVSVQYAGRGVARA